MKIKFAHVSDCHLGAWRKDTLNKIGCVAFEKMIDKILEEEVDFVILAGDLYDVSNPKVDIVDFATKQLKRLNNKGIPVYGIMGSHDFSPSDKSMIRPLISAGLFKNVSIPEWVEESEHPLRLRFEIDPKTKIKITGMRAKKRSLELEDYEMLDTPYLDHEEGIKIFILHTLLSEMKPIEYKNMASGPKSMLPQNFWYYAGGHLHKTVPEELREGPIPIKKDSKFQKRIVYPGSLYPTDSRELETFQYGGFCLISGDIPQGDLTVEYIPLKIKEVSRIYIDANNKSISKVKEIIEQEIIRGKFEDKIVVVRMEGEVSSGKSHEIPGNEIVQQIREKGAYEVLINKANLTSAQYEKISIDSSKTNEQIESELIYAHAQQIEIHGLSKKEVEHRIHQLLGALGKEREEGGKVKDYDAQIIESFYNILDIATEEGNK